MPIPFPSDEWIKALMADLNASDAYRQAAAKWEGDFFFVIGPGGTLPEPVTLYMDLWHGECRNAFVESDHQHSPAFKLTGPVATWKKVITRQLDPIQAMMTGQLHVVGNMVMIMKNVRAAKELVAACTRIPTIFPL